MPAQPRDLARRRTDTLAALTATPVDAWVASAGAGGPYLVPLSLVWVDERVVLALDGASRTARNVAAHGAARIGVGPTRDVVMIDALLERTVPVGGDDALAGAYAARSDWDPRRAGDGYVFLVLRPDRIQAWREADELSGRVLMRDGRWLG
jgi:hypothetical protein